MAAMPMLVPPPMTVPMMPAIGGGVDIAPKHSIYINNLNDRIKIEPMKKALHAACSQFGAIIDIVMRKSYRLRGQAFIIFKDIDSAAKAVRTMNGFIFYDKPLIIRYSKTESDLITKQQGNFLKRPALAPVEVRKPREKSMRVNPASVPEQEPNNILFLTNLPDETNESMLTILFNQFLGYKEVRLIPGRSDIAFVEFDNEYHAGAAKDALNGYNLSLTHKLHITFAKK